jgi:hypothetical protein
MISNLVERGGDGVEEPNSRLVAGPKALEHGKLTC